MTINEITGFPKKRYSYYPVSPLFQAALLSQVALLSQIALLAQVTLLSQVALLFQVVLLSQVTLLFQVLSLFLISNFLLSGTLNFSVLSLVLLFVWFFSLIPESLPYFRILPCLSFLRFSLRFFLPSCFPDA